MKFLEKIIVITSVLAVILLIKPTATKALEISVFPENSRLSFRGALATDNLVGTSLITIKDATDSANHIYSVNSGQLMSGDVLTVSNIGYVVATTSAKLRSNEIALSGVLTSENNAENTPVVYLATGRIKISVSGTIAAGDKINFLFPIGDETAAAYNDSLPDEDGFDFNANATVDCPTGFTAETPIPATTDLRYHLFTCINEEEEKNLTNEEFYINNLINPTGSDSQASILKILAQQANSLDAILTTETANVGFAGAVKMTVRIAPQLTFKIAGVANNQAACGNTTSITTTGNLIDFGGIDAVTPKDAAQKITITTNAAGGYVISALSSDQMSLDGAGCAGDGENDTACILGHSSAGVPLPWTSGAGGRFAFTMSAINGDTYQNDGVPNVLTAFSYDGAQAANVTAGWSSFADAEANEVALPIITNLRSTNGDEVDICYRILAASDTVPGDYQTAITYTITASF